MQPRLTRAQTIGTWSNGAATPYAIPRRDSGFESSISAAYDQSRGDEAYERGHWEDDSPNCSLCGREVGNFTRHHCRICGKCVCAGCSPSKLQMEGYRRTQRACTPCVGEAQASFNVKSRLGQIGSRLWSLGISAETGAATTTAGEPRTLEEATALCEAALLPMESALEDARAEAAKQNHARQQLEASVLELIKKLGGRLHALIGAEAGESKPPLSVAEAFERCESALEPLVCLLAEGRRSSVGSRFRVRSRSVPKSGDEGGASPLVRGACSPKPETLARRRCCTGDVPVKEEASSCSVCCDRLGKRFLRRRHHCRTCGRSVCDKCSPSFIQLEGQKALQRICTPCVADVPKAADLRARMTSLGSRLSVLGGAAPMDKTPSSPCPTTLRNIPDNAMLPRGTSPTTPGAASLEEGMSFCEKALASLEGRKDNRLGSDVDSQSAASSYVGMDLMTQSVYIPAGAGVFNGL